MQEFQKESSIIFDEAVKIKNSCRVCTGNNLQQVLSLGLTPPANAFLKQESLNQSERFFPLDLQFCNDCNFVQLAHLVSPELLFRDYVYVSSTSPSFVNHFQSLTEEICSRFNLPRNSLVVDIGSNDGILLRPFKNQGMRVLGVDPAVKIAAMATQNGVETIPEFFTPEIAKKIVRSHGKAKIVTATSVFPHIDNLDLVVEGVKELLDEEGVFIIEAYYLVDLLQKNLFDTIYHEHLSYFTVKTINKLFQRLGMNVFHVEKTDTHGGSIRVFVQKENNPYQVQESVDNFIRQETELKLDKLSTHLEFYNNIEKNKTKLLQTLKDIKSKGKKIVGYGAAAKANTLLNYFQIGKDILDYVVDDSSWKQGLFTPGTKIPVVSSDKLYSDKPDYILILAWNFAEQIMKKYPDFVNFIVPVPEPQILNNIVEQDLEEVANSIRDEARLLEGKTVLITGGSGFIGSYMVASLDYLNKKVLKVPCKIISTDNHIVGQRNNLIKNVDNPNVVYMQHDIIQPLEIEEQVDYVVMAAGVASPVYYKKFPIETIDVTIFGVKNTLELCRKKNVKSALFFSSSEIYGDPDPNFIPTPEHYKGNVSSIGPRACYDESKRIGETICMAYHKVHNVPVKVVRPFNVYGPGMLGADYRVIPSFLSQGLQGKPLTVHDKGNQTRTFCYATDAIIGFFKVLLSDRSGEIYNIGNPNEEINMNSLAETVADTFGGGVEINLVKYPDNYPQDEPRRRCPDLTKIRSHLGFAPKLSLADGLKRSLNWMRHHHS